MGKSNNAVKKIQNRSKWQTKKCK